MQLGFTESKHDQVSAISLNGSTLSKTTLLSVCDRVCVD